MRATTSTRRSGTRGRPRGDSLERVRTEPPKNSRPTSSRSFRARVRTKPTRRFGRRSTSCFRRWIESTFRDARRAIVSTSRSRVDFGERID
ncbi:hypothetical protein D8S78_15845 [Natrialba swarupiae]|nr:hypothetical protein [Natrialba swarupiae]